MELEEQTFLLKKLKNLQKICEKEVPGVYETWAKDSIDSLIETLRDDIKQQKDDLKAFHQNE